LFSNKGVVVSGYGVEITAAIIGKLPHMQARFDASQAAIEKLHPGV